MILSALALFLAPSAAFATPIPVLGTGTAGFVGLSQDGPLDQPTLVTSYEEFVAVFGASPAGLANPYLAPSVAGFFLNGGLRLYVVRVATADPDAFIGNDGGPPGTRTGLQSLVDVDEVAVVAIPGATSLTVQAALIAHAEATNDRLAILDPVTTDGPQVVQDQRAALDAAQGHAALYFPWVWAEPTGDLLLLPPSGLVAGIFAGTDTPDSPVGSIVSAIDVSYYLTDPEQDILNPLGINAIRLFGGGDVRVWGARTLATNPEWRYIAVRRTGLCLEESIQTGTAWAVFEPNDEPLWAQLRADVTDFMYERWLAGWFQGATPEDAFFVRCDASTMTPEDIAAGRTIILVGFAPQAPAEFVLITILHERPATAVSPELVDPSPVLLAATPNPFNPRTVIGFDLPRGGPASLRIYDLAGRVVRELLAGEDLVAGRHEYRWDGRDGSGAGVPSGVYLVRLVAGSSTRAGRVTLVR